MSANWQDGNAQVTEPALPGTYGEAPAGFRLPAATRLGPVRLQVGDLERSIGFYVRTLGLGPIAEAGATAALGAPGSDVVLLELWEGPGAGPAQRRGQLGLYHFAILLPDRASLGRLVRHLAGREVPIGAGDHLVSEAIYLSDPDGLGIEVYADRPRASWRRIGRQLVMAADPVDIAALVTAGGEVPWAGLPPDTTIGHVHLHVGDLASASAFYADGLGFDRTVWSYPGALFFSAGGYHHHLGTNTWAGAGALPPPPAAARLLHWTIQLPGAGVLGEAVRHLESLGLACRTSADGSVVVPDPWGTAVRLSVQAPPGPNRVSQLSVTGEP